MLFGLDILCSVTPLMHTVTTLVITQQQYLLITSRIVEGSTTTTTTHTTQQVVHMAGLHTCTTMGTTAMVTPEPTLTTSLNILILGIDTIRSQQHGQLGQRFILSITTQLNQVVQAVQAEQVEQVEPRAWLAPEDAQEHLQTEQQEPQEAVGDLFSLQRPHLQAWSTILLAQHREATLPLTVCKLSC
jgi:hypothetical protein